MVRRSAAFLASLTVALLFAGLPARADEIKAGEVVVPPEEPPPAAAPAARSSPAACSEASTSS